MLDEKIKCSCRGGQVSLVIHEYPVSSVGFKFSFTILVFSLTLNLKIKLQNVARVFQGISSHSNSLSSWYLVILLNSKTKRFAAGRNKVLKSKETFDKNNFFEQN